MSNIVIQGYGPGGSPIVMGYGGGLYNPTPTITYITLTAQWSFSTQCQYATGSTSGVFTRIPSAQRLSTDTVNHSRYYYTYNSQYFLNMFPRSTDARGNYLSVTQQLLNPTALYFDKFERATADAILNFFPQSIACTEWDVTSITNLPYSFNFTKKVSSTGDVSYTPPKVFGISGPEKRKLLVAERNDIQSTEESFPTRYTKVKEISIDASGTYYEFGLSPITEASIQFEEPVNIFLLVDNFTRFVFYNTVDNRRVRTTIRLTGITERDIEEYEEFTPLYNGHYITSKKFITINKVEVVNGFDEDLDTGKIYLSPIPIRLGEDPDEILKDYSFTYVSPDSPPNMKRNVWWQLSRCGNPNGSDGAAATVSSLIMYARPTDDPELILNGFHQLSPQTIWALQDINGETIEALQIASGTDFLFALGYPTTDDSKHYLYMFDKRLEYPSLNTIQLLDEMTPEYRTYLLLQDYDPSSPNLNADGNRIIDFAIQCTDPHQDMEQVRVSIIDPANIETYIDIRTLEPVSADAAWGKLAKNDNGWISHSGQYTLTEFGDYIFRVETLYKDGGFDDYRVVVRNLVKKATARYNLSIYGLDGIQKFSNILVRDDDTIVLIPTGDTSVGYIFESIKDLCTIDYEDKQVFIPTTEYSAIEVTP